MLNGRIMAVPLFVAAVTLGACDSDSPSGPDSSTVRTFTVTLAVPGNSPSPIAPGLFVVHDSGEPLFTREAPDRGLGLEQLAEDGNPAVLAGSLGTVFNTPVGDSSPAPATPGRSYSFSFDASPGHHLSFATMYVQSNDLFYAPHDSGLPLFNGSTPVTGSVTREVRLWDAGTEVNQPPGTGPDQAPRQSGPDTGPSERAGIEPVEARDSYSYGSALEVTISVE